MYASFKSSVWGALPLGGDATEILLGFVVFLLTLMVFRRPLNSWWAALPTVICALTIALLDILVLGQGLGWTLRDAALFSVIPVVMTLIYRMSWAK
jgi:hypothetical protein